jgi:hypothetical protein
MIWLMMIVGLILWERGGTSGRGWRTNNEEAEEHEPKVLLVTRDPVGHTLFLTGIVGQYTYSLSGVVGDAYTAEVSLATFLLF